MKPDDYTVGTWWKIEVCPQIIQLLIHINGNTLREELSLSSYLKKKDFHCVMRQFVFLCCQHLIELYTSNWNIESKLIRNQSRKWLNLSIMPLKTYFVDVWYEHRKYTAERWIAFGIHSLAKWWRYSWRYPEQQRCPKYLEGKTANTRAPRLERKLRKVTGGRGKDSCL